MIKVKILTTLFGLTLFSVSLAQFKPNNYGGFTLSIQVDSSHCFVVGGQPNKSEKTKYVTEDRTQGFTSYTGEVTLWTNAYVYNDSTEKILKLFDLPLIGVYPALNTMESLRYDYFYQRTLISGVSKDNLIFLVKNDAYNNDGVIDSEDPVHIFVSKKDGTDCKQITANSMNVTSWRLIKDGMGILFTAQSDKNSDKKFTEDEELYQIDLDSNISKVKLKPILTTK